MRLYKLTDQNMQTFGGFHWELGKVYGPLDGDGPLCSGAWFHAYTSPYLAVLLNPLHGAIPDPRMFVAAGHIGASDFGLKVGCRSLRLTAEMPVPTIPTDARIEFAIRTALRTDATPQFRRWAADWLSGRDRTSESAAWAAWAAASAAEWAASAAESAARAAAWAASATEWAAESAARARLPLARIARECVRKYA